MLTTTQADAAYTNGRLIRRLFALAWRYRLRCLQVLGLQLVLLTMGLFGLGLTGIGIDFIRHKVEHAPLLPNKLRLALPDNWPALNVLALIGAIILGLAAGRAVL
ncbi:MAG TPA: ABC transporter ATP-binding protein, partial [Opitutaceae bacterium]|nr:ABC transporter ATP-binding protein [Opitutaceae bacterium]